jgi:hypothetical protein
LFPPSRDIFNDYSFPPSSFINSGPINCTPSLFVPTSSVIIAKRIDKKRSYDCIPEKKAIHLKDKNKPNIIPLSTSSPVEVEAAAGPSITFVPPFFSCRQPLWYTYSTTIGHSQVIYGKHSTFHHFSYCAQPRPSTMYVFSVALL